MDGIGRMVTGGLLADGGDVEVNVPAGPVVPAVGEDGGQLPFNVPTTNRI
jgi:hypothetical protein